MDQHGCGENDPNGPVFDPVHGVIHHFYQIHLAARPGHGPDYGHFVSKDFVNWVSDLDKLLPYLALLRALLRTCTANIKGKG